MTNCREGDRMLRPAEPLLFTGAQLKRNWPFGEFAPGSYGLIVADPPWHFSVYSEKGEEKSAQAHYDTMSIDEIARLPVGDLAAQSCVLWLWATAPMIDQQIAIAARWGFTFKTSGVWVKTTRTGKLAFGTGYVLRNCHEPFIIATSGSPQTSKSVRSVVMAPGREHSRKPDVAFEVAEQLVPNVARIELFSRENRTGWDAWGDEAGKFDGVIGDEWDDIAVTDQPDLFDGVDIDVGNMGFLERAALEAKRTTKSVPA